MHGISNTLPHDVKEVSEGAQGVFGLNHRNGSIADRADERIMRAAMFACLELRSVSAPWQT